MTRARIQITLILAAIIGANALADDILFHGAPLKWRMGRKPTILLVLVIVKPPNYFTVSTRAFCLLRRFRTGLF